MKIVAIRILIVRTRRQSLFPCTKSAQKSFFFWATQVQKGLKSIFPRTGSEQNYLPYPKKSLPNSFIALGISIICKAAEIISGLVNRLEAIPCRRLLNECISLFFPKFTKISSTTIHATGKTSARSLGSSGNFANLSSRFILLTFWERSEMSLREISEASSNLKLLHLARIIFAERLQLHQDQQLAKLTPGLIRLLYLLP